MVDDNFHYMDEDKRYKHGAYDTLEDAIRICKNIVESSIKYVNRAKAKDAFLNYCAFGDQPFIIGDDSFDSRAYASAYCKKHYQ